MSSYHVYCVICVCASHYQCVSVFLFVSEMLFLCWFVSLFVCFPALRPLVGVRWPALVVLSVFMSVRPCVRIGGERWSACLLSL